jgi:hypothetical protein
MPTHDRASLRAIPKSSHDRKPMLVSVTSGAAFALRQDVRRHDTEGSAVHTETRELRAPRGSR